MGQLRTTPWNRAELQRLGIDIDDLQARVPFGYALHISERKPRGPWYVRLFVRENGVSRELTQFTKTAPGFPDLGHAIDYVLGMAAGHGR